MKLGVIIALSEQVDADFERLKGLGLNTCQLNCWNPEMFTEENAERVNRAAKKHNIEITAFWCGWSGPTVWDFRSGPNTLGLVPEEYRFTRMKELVKGLDFAKKIHVTDVATHAGFIPENPSSSEYCGTVEAVRYVAQHAKENGQYFLFETGQETPVTLKRLIEDVGTGNLGINLDPANLLMYGKANPVDALEVFGQYVRGVHGKDGKYPTDGYHLGEEMRIGDGKVDYPVFVAKLKECGYDGAITIEREITGEKQIEDIKYAKEFLEKLI